ncbi:hypothetical protein OY671_008992, partial [Metschnikowia pulcherrima]
RAARSAAGAGAFRGAHQRPAGAHAAGLSAGGRSRSRGIRHVRPRAGRRGPGAPDPRHAADHRRRRRQHRPAAQRRRRGRAGAGRYRQAGVRGPRPVRIARAVRRPAGAGQPLSRNGAHRRARRRQTARRARPEGQEDRARRTGVGGARHAGSRAGRAWPAGRTRLRGGAHPLHRFAAGAERRHDRRRRAGHRHSRHALARRADPGAPEAAAARSGRDQGPGRAGQRADAAGDTGG